MATRKKKKQPAQDLSPQALEKVFRSLSAASGKLFTSNTTFLITEESAHILLTETFATLADAAKRGRLQQASTKILAGAGTERVEVGAVASKLIPAWSKLPVFSETSGRKVAKDIKDCVFPPVP